MRDDHDHADGQRRRLDEPFDIGGEAIDKPDDGSAKKRGQLPLCPSLRVFR